MSEGQSTCQGEQGEGGGRVPLSLAIEAVTEYLGIVRGVTDVGLAALGPAFTAAMLEFAGAAVERRARMDGSWRPEEAAECRAALGRSLGELQSRWEQRRAAGTEPVREPS